MDGLSKLAAMVEGWFRAPCAVAVAFAFDVAVAGDFLTCWGEERGPRGENAAWAAENGVETGGVAATCDCEGVLPCCEKECFMALAPALGVAIITSTWHLAPSQMQRFV